MINFKFNEALIKQLKKVVKVNGEVHVTGCGNYYSNKADAIRKKNFTNPDQEEATFMLSFYKVDDVPNTPRDLEDAFFQSRREEVKNYAEKEIRANKNIIDMSDDDDEAKETKKGKNPKE